MNYFSTYGYLHYIITRRHNIIEPRMIIITLTAPEYNMTEYVLYDVAL
jgi:hypothetical protein